MRLDVDRERASQLGLDQKEVVDNVITALNSNGMIAPSYWVDPHSGNDYLLTVQYREDQIKSLSDLKQIPLRGANAEKSHASWTPWSNSRRWNLPPRWITTSSAASFDLYVSPSTENLGGVTKRHSTDH